MKTVFLSLVMVMLYFIHPMKAQEFFKVKAGEDPKKAIPPSVQYFYPQFQPGRVIFFNGNNTNAQLNYNLLLGEIHFVGTQNDTLSLTNEQLIKMIIVGKQPFVFAPKYGYLLIEPNDSSSVRLGSKQQFRLSNLEKIGAYQQSTGVSSIRTFTVFSNGNGSVQKLDPKGDIVFSKNITYYFVDKNNSCYKASKSSLFKILPKYKKQITNYLQENRPDFRNEKDLKAIIQFCRQFT